MKREIKRTVKREENQIRERGHCKKARVNGKLLSEEIRRYFSRKRKRSIRNLLTILAGEKFFNQIGSHNPHSFRSSPWSSLTTPGHRKDNCCPRLDNHRIKSPPRLVSPLAHVHARARIHVHGTYGDKFVR